MGAALARGVPGTVAAPSGPPGQPAFPQRFVYLSGTTGEVAERLNAPVSKTGMGGFVHRGFESLPLRAVTGAGGAWSLSGPSGAPRPYRRTLRMTAVESANASAAIAAAPAMNAAWPAA